MSKQNKSNIPDDWEKRIVEQNKMIDKNLKRKDYVLTVIQTGCEGMSNGDSNRQLHCRRFFVPVSLEEIPKYIEFMTESFWLSPKDMTEKEKKKISFEDKKWGKYSNITIEPLSEELEKSYLNGSKKGWFKNYREYSEFRNREL